MHAHEVDRSVDICWRRHEQGYTCFWAHRGFCLLWSPVKDLDICCCCSTETSRAYCRRQILCVHTYDLYIPRTPTNFALACTNTLTDKLVTLLLLQELLSCFLVQIYVRVRCPKLIADSTET